MGHHCSRVQEIQQTRQLSSRKILYRMSRMAVIFMAIVALAAAQEHSENSIVEIEQTPGIIERVQTYVSANVLEPIREMDWRAMLRSLLDQVMEYMAPERKEPKIAGEYHVGQDRAVVMARRLFNGVLSYMLDNRNSTQQQQQY